MTASSPLRIVLPALVGFDHQQIGGLGTYVHGLAPRLRALGHTVLVLGYGPPETEQDGFRPGFDRRPPRGRDLSWALWKHRKRWDFPADTVVQVERPDHGMAFRAGPWPLVVSFHGLHGREIPRGRCSGSGSWGAMTRRRTSPHSWRQCPPSPARNSGWPERAG